MTIRQFIFIAFVCAFETYFFNDSLIAGHFLFAGFWAFLLFRDLRKAYAINKFSKELLKASRATKKKD
ncbi:DUF3272 domain-containing protein [Streptococcus didelphis]|uniref:DUF3272 domain-containing protein n=1 Tax=Streptococcus didelphis TaxID=102886 RepID=A0ABY9LGT3_9STRE|nr:DUF3272 family protein [Streptococcus didelphis]WMB28100.1 DUF3272 domain-containing protein [Streptococcus didelphis]WMB30018.1 DUF3272 domain-containing protein [Streptococcus didelphis]